MPLSEKDRLLKLVRDGLPLTTGQQIRLAAALSVPAIMSQISTIIMQYIDASMVGRLGASASAAIGLISTSTWLLGGLVGSAATGFAVQVAHKIGASNNKEARVILRQALTACFLFSLIIMAFGVSISDALPGWLGGNEEICKDASIYFMIFCFTLPIHMIRRLGGSMLRCAGNVKVPSLLNVFACCMDVVFNYFLIYKMNMGVKGAALGTMLAETITMVLMQYFLCFRSEELRLTHEKGSFKPDWLHIRLSLKIGLPMGIEHVIFCAAQIVSTIIVAPLGTVAIAANAFGITIESLCYMPGYGIGDAATTLVGQSLGAGRRDLCKKFATITIWMGVAVMSFMGVIMFVTSPYLMTIMTPDVMVQELSTKVLRIEAFAEPFYAASIVAYSVFVGMGKTIKPCVMNLISIWCVRITLAALLASSMGLVGVWLAMAIELTFRGIIQTIILYYDFNKESRVRG